ncbi:MAG: diguanylate cyclase (GGDEF domain) with PAS/PAC sensor [Nitrosopumilales archaeon]|nr:MAG: diguanylate cyclase (GGDEF domain) with PAS/PAC sensor [Nitrosopumilales archaeon]
MRMNFFNVIMYGRSVVYHFSTERTFLHFMRRLEGFYLNIAYKGKFTEKSIEKKSSWYHFGNCGWISSFCWNIFFGFSGKKN